MHAKRCVLHTCIHRCFALPRSPCTHSLSEPMRALIPVGSCRLNAFVGSTADGCDRKCFKGEQNPKERRTQGRKGHTYPSYDSIVIVSFTGRPTADRQTSQEVVDKRVLKQLDYPGTLNAGAPPPPKSSTAVRAHERLTNRMSVNRSQALWLCPAPKPPKIHQIKYTPGGPAAVSQLLLDYYYTPLGDKSTATTRETRRRKYLR